MPQQDLVPATEFAELYELPSAAAVVAVDDESVDAAPVLDAPLDTDVIAPANTSDVVEQDDLLRAVVSLAAALEDERAQRAEAEEARRSADSEVHAARAEMARLTAELHAAVSRCTQLEADRDDVIRRAEELLNALRERGDQRLAAELDSARRHWEQLLADERRRVEVLDGERASLLRRLEDAWTAGGGGGRRVRPLRPWAAPDDDAAAPAAPSVPTTVNEEVPGAEAGATELLDHEDSVPDGETPELTAEVERLRQRLRAQLHKPVDMSEVEDGVDRLRESRLAREKPGRRRKR